MACQPEGLSAINQRMIIQVVTFAGNLHALLFPLIGARLRNNLSGLIKKYETAIARVYRVEKARQFILAGFARLIGHIGCWFEWKI
ncbi:MAG TPA: hypothetical protein DCZ04_00720, partial [Syntrophorhabdus aromaticivorans]|nr:hypothetical protein [Syntrophorhabdus aromaticivorans]